MGRDAQARALIRPFDPGVDALSNERNQVSWGLGLDAATERDDGALGGVHQATDAFVGQSRDSLGVSGQQLRTFELGLQSTSTAHEIAAVVGADELEREIDRVEGNREGQGEVAIQRADPHAAPRIRIDDADAGVPHPVRLQTWPHARDDEGGGGGHHWAWAGRQGDLSCGQIEDRGHTSQLEEASRFRRRWGAHALGIAPGIAPGVRSDALVGVRLEAARRQEEHAEPMRCHLCSLYGTSARRERSPRVDEPTAEATF